MYDNLRFTGLSKADDGFGGGANGKLGSIVTRTLEMGLDPFSIEGMRESGYRAMEALLASDSFRNAAAPLPTMPDSTVAFDTAVINVGRERLQFVADLIDAGLTRPLPEFMAIPFLEQRTRGRSATARRVMNPTSRGENSLALMGAARLPIYLTMADNQIGIRELRMSQRMGIPLDTANIEDDVRAVNEAIEDAALNGATTLDGQALQVNGYNAPGLLNAPNANTKSLSLADWKTTPNGTNIMVAITQMQAQLIADKQFGAVRLYVPSAVGIAWQVDFKANGNDSILARLGQIPNFTIRTLDMMPATKIVMIRLASDVVDIIVGQQPTVIPFTSLDGFTLYNVILACMVPRFKSDSDGNSGVVVGTMS